MIKVRLLWFYAVMDETRYHPERTHTKMKRSLPIIQPADSQNLLLHLLAPSMLIWRCNHGRCHRATLPTPAYNQPTQRLTWAKESSLRTEATQRKTNKSPNVPIR